MSAFNTVCVLVFIYGTGMILAVLFYEILKKILPRVIAFALMFAYCFSIGWVFCGTFKALGVS